MRIRSIVFYLASFVCFAPGAGAQETPIWSDIDCSQSKLVAPAGLRCRATQEYSGGSRVASGSGAGGISRDWAMIGTINGSKLYYFGKEALTSKSSIFPYVLADGVKSLSPQGKGATGFSAPAQSAGGNYLRFKSAAGESCIGILKEGSARPKGFKWILIASKCVPVGKSIPDPDITSFIAAADFHD